MAPRLKGNSPIPFDFEGVRMSEQNMGPAMGTAVLGGGCFWCVEAVFSQLKGINSVRSGYTGGYVANPTYEQVCDGDTGHIEVAHISFDPAELSFGDVLRAFFASHDPTTPDRQGNDIGPQYESVIFALDDEQRQKARQIIAEFGEQQQFGAPIVTEIRDFEKFWPAESYHDDYFARHPQYSYCQVVIAPKVAKFREQFQDRLIATDR
jgi:peptide-methionine (S)-S-oxide reductase